MIPNQHAMQIKRAGDIPDLQDHLRELEEIFFESSARQKFVDLEDRARFRWQWLDRYVENHEDSFFVAVDNDGRVVGYLAGCLEDPRASGHFADIGYFDLLFDLLSDYPAHLHINVASQHRNCGIGARLIELFVEWATLKSVAGIHIVTSSTSRSVPFYRRCGFRELRTFSWNDNATVCMGRRL